MKGKWLVLIILLIVFSGGRMVMANGENHKAPSTTSINGKGSSGTSMAGMDMNGKDKNMDMSGSQKDSSMAGMDMNGKDKNMDMSGSKKVDNMAGMDMGEKPIKETPPNFKILGAYGAVNLVFILIGVWSKWFRRKDGSYVSAN